MSIFTPNIPAAANAPSADQPLMQNNFDALQNAQDKNHMPLSDTVNRGLHKFVEMPVQVGAQTTAVGEGELHTQTVGGTSQLYYSRDNSAGTLVQLTTAIVPSVATSGYSFLPGGLIIQWAQVTLTGSGIATFPTAFPTAALFVNASPFNSSAGSADWYVSTWNATTVTFGGTSNGMRFTYIAIGY